MVTYYNKKMDFDVTRTSFKTNYSFIRRVAVPGQPGKKKTTIIQVTRKRKCNNE